MSLTVYPGDRIALLGRNGAGKSTLIKLLAGELAARGGTRDDARDLATGYFAQHQLEQLDPAASPLLHLQRLAQSLGQRPSEQEQRDYLAGFGFRGDRVFEPVAPFSGGEKARLALALVAYTQAQPAAAGRAHQPSGSGDAPGTGHGAAGIRRRRGHGVA